MAASASAPCKILAIWLLALVFEPRRRRRNNKTTRPEFTREEIDLVEAHRLQPGDEDDGGRVDREDQSAASMGVSVPLRAKTATASWTKTMLSVSAVYCQAIPLK